MSDLDFEHLARQVQQRSGLNLGPEKAYLVRSRLEPVAKAHGFADAPAMLAEIRRTNAAHLVQRCTEALATHESSFFRDGAPFDILRTDLIPELMRSRAATRSLRIWCAACSSGQEPYSVAIMLREMGLQPLGWKIEILATDFSRPILEKARAGLYNEFEMKRGLSVERVERWFERVDGSWRVAPLVRQMVSFREHNLLESACALGKFDIVLCRNVMIYFDTERKRRALANLSAAMAPDAALVLGSAETVMGLSTQLIQRGAARGIFGFGSSRLAA